MASSKHEINMTQGNMVPKIIRFAIPLVFSGILQLLFHTADTVVVGRFAGEASLAAVGACGPVINLIVNAFIGFSTGATIVVSRYFGENSYEGMQKATHSAITMSVIIGAFIAILGNLVVDFMIKFVGMPEDVIPLGRVYLRIYFSGAPFIMLYNFASGIMRSYGDTKRPLYYLIVAGVINVVLNLVFVIEFKMNVAGVALATIISQAVSAYLTLRTLTKVENGCNLDLKKLCIHKKQFVMIVRAGIPAGLQSCMFNISNLLISSSVNSFGTIAVAGNAAASSVEGFILVAETAMTQAAVTATAQNYGAKKFKRAFKAWQICTVCVIVAMLLLSVVALAFAKPILSAFSDNEAVLEIGVRRLFYIVPLYMMCGVMDIAVSSLRGIGYYIAPMMVSVFGICVFRVLWIYTVFAYYRTLPCLYISYPVSWMLTGAVQIVLFMICLKKQEKQYNESLKEGISV
ncbi:MAG: MATE family efflux transporter [Ruminococcaceae bacterium]|nr:MATE family efflux transporter [Oscillospiraceae bacterium]